MVLQGEVKGAACLDLSLFFAAGWITAGEGVVLHRSAGQPHPPGPGGGAQNFVLWWLVQHASPGDQLRVPESWNAIPSLLCSGVKAAPLVCENMGSSLPLVRTGNSQGGKTVLCPCPQLQNLLVLEPCYFQQQDSSLRSALLEKLLSSSLQCEMLWGRLVFIFLFFFFVLLEQLLSSLLLFPSLLLLFL